MKILFYYDPTIYYNNPIWRQPHILFDKALYTNLINSSIEKCECKMLIPEHYDLNLIQQHGIKSEDIITISPTVIYNAFKKYNIEQDINMFFLNHPKHPLISEIGLCYKEHIRPLTKLDSDEQMQGSYGGQNRNILNKLEDSSIGATTQLTSEIEYCNRSIQDFIPNIIITWTPAPHLKSIFPNSLVLHQEKGLIQGKNWGKSFYLDQWGFYSHSYFSNFIKNKYYRHLESDTTELEKLRISLKNKNNNLIAKIKVSLMKYKFKKICLLPLHYSGYFTFDYYSKFKSQFEFAKFVLDKLPQDIGLIITLNNHSNITKSELELLDKNYKNSFVCNIKNKSDQYLNYIDGIITVNSSLALKALLLQKPVFCLDNDNYLGDLVFSNLDNIHYKIENHCKTYANQALIWMLNDYFIDYSKLNTPNYGIELLHKKYDIKTKSA